MASGHITLSLYINFNPCPSGHGSSLIVMSLLDMFKTKQLKNFQCYCRRCKDRFLASNYPGPLWVSNHVMLTWIVWIKNTRARRTLPWMRGVLGESISVLGWFAWNPISSACRELMPSQGSASLTLHDSPPSPIKSSFHTMVGDCVSTLKYYSPKVKVCVWGLHCPNSLWTNSLH